jgi:hypothetical protein
MRKSFRLLLWNRWNWLNWEELWVIILVIYIWGLIGIPRKSECTNIGICCPFTNRTLRSSHEVSEMLLDMLQLYAEHHFEGIPTGDESWFLYTTYGDWMLVTSAREVVSRTDQNISAKKIMVTIFFTSTRSLVLNFLPKGTMFNQDYVIDTVLPNLYSE